MAFSTFFMVIKYASTAITGIAGIWGTVNDTRDKNGGLTLWGKWALGLAVAGFIVAILSQIGEQVAAGQEKEEANRDADAARVSLTKQLTMATQELAIAQQALAVAQNSSTAIESTRTRFDSITFMAVFELQKSNQLVLKVAGELDGFLASYNGPENTSWGKAVRGKGLVMLPNRFDPKTLPSFPRFNDFLKSISSGSVQLTIYKPAPRGGVPGSTPPDSGFLKAKSTFNNQDLVVIYSARSQKLYVTIPKGEFKASDWDTDYRVSGISDLSQARFVLQFFGAAAANNASIAQLFEAMQPYLGDITFGNHECILKNLNKTRSRAGSAATGFTTTLPDANLIRNDMTSKFDPAQLAL